MKLENMFFKLKNLICDSQISLIVCFTIDLGQYTNLYHWNFLNFLVYLSKLFQNIKIFMWIGKLC